MAYIENGPVRLYVEHLQGKGSHEGGHPLLLLHGGIVGTKASSRLREYMGLLAPLRGTDMPLFLFDRRGCGRSDAAFFAHSWQAYREDVGRVLQHIGSSQVVLMGSSFGAAIALSYALEHPERVKALVLDAVTGGAANPLHRQLYAVQRQWVAEHGVERWLEWLRQRGRPWLDPWTERAKSDEAFRSELANCPRDRVVTALSNMEKLVPQDDAPLGIEWPSLRELALPMLIVAGDDALHPRRLAMEMASRARSAQLCLPRGGAEETEAHILPFLKWASF